MNFYKILDAVIKASTTELGEQLTELFCGVDGKLLIREEEVKKHIEGKLDKGTEPLEYKAILHWVLPIEEEDVKLIELWCQDQIAAGELPVDFLFHANGLIKNAIQTPDGTIIESLYRHDYQTHIDGVTGKEYMVDGGLDYARRSDNGDERDLSVVDNGTLSSRRICLKWGNTMDKDGKPLGAIRWVPIAQMNNSHIEAVLKSNQYILPKYRETMEAELLFRKRKGIVI